MSRFAERTVSPTKAARLNSLFDQLEQDRKNYVDQYRLKSLVMDSVESEQQQYEGSNSNSHIENAQAEYNKKRHEMQNYGFNNPANRSSTPFDNSTKSKASNSNNKSGKSFDGLKLNNGEPKLASSATVYNMFEHGARQHGRG